MAKVHDGLDRFKRGGVRKIWVYRALDDGREVMILQEIDNEINARQWIDHPDAAAEWMSNVGFRRLSHAVRRQVRPSHEHRREVIGR